MEETKTRKVRVTLVKSAIGYNKKQKATAKALGLRRMNDSVVLNETQQVQGMINAISHLVHVEEVDE